MAPLPGPRIALLSTALLLLRTLCCWRSTRTSQYSTPFLGVHPSILDGPEDQPERLKALVVALVHCIMPGTALRAPLVTLLALQCLRALALPPREVPGVQISPGAELQALLVDAGAPLVALATALALPMSGDAADAGAAPSLRVEEMVLDDISALLEDLLDSGDDDNSPTPPPSPPRSAFFKHSSPRPPFGTDASPDSEHYRRPRSMSSDGGASFYDTVLPREELFGAIFHESVLLIRTIIKLLHRGGKHCRGETVDFLEQLVTPGLVHHMQQSNPAHVASLLHCSQEVRTSRVIWNPSMRQRTCQHLREQILRLSSASVELRWPLWHPGDLLAADGFLFQFPELAKEETVGGLFLSSLEYMLPTLDLEGASPQDLMQDLLKSIQDDQGGKKPGTASSVRAGVSHTHGKLRVLEAIRQAHPQDAADLPEIVEHTEQSGPGGAASPGTVVLALPKTKARS